MPVNEEKFNAHCEATKEEYEKWNSEQPPEYKILYRVPFDTEFPEIKFGNEEKKAYKGKGDQPDGTNRFQKIKAIDSQGSETTYKIQIPTANAPRGYTTIKTDNGELDAIPLVLDTKNPDHAIFISEYDDKITKPAIHMVMQNPGFYGSSFQSIIPLKKIDEKTMLTQEYNTSKHVIMAVMAQYIRKPNISKGVVDHSSLLRHIFLTPLNYKDPEKPDSPPNEMRVSWKHTPKVDAVAIGRQQLFDLCLGIKRDENGKQISQKRLGFQCSGEIVISKFNIGTKLSCKTSCTALTIFSFFESKFKDTQAEKHAFVDEYGTLDAMNDSMNPYILEMLAGLSTNSPAIPTGNTFNPSGVESGSVTSLPDVGSGSLLGNINQKSTPMGATSPNEGLVNIINNQPILPMQQQNPSMVNPSFGMNSGNFNGMPPSPFGGQQMPPPFQMNIQGGDRLNTFNPSMVPMNNAI